MYKILVSLFLATAFLACSSKPPVSSVDRKAAYFNSGLQEGDRFTIKFIQPVKITIPYDQNYYGINGEIYPCNLRGQINIFLKNNPGRKDRHIPSGYTFNGILSKSATVDKRNSSTWYLLPVDENSTDIKAIGIQENLINDDYDSFERVISSPDFVFSKFIKIKDFNLKENRTRKQTD